jgi:hypothetical protein
MDALSMAAAAFARGQASKKKPVEKREWHSSVSSQSAASTLEMRCDEAERTIEAQRVTIRRLQQAVAAAERRAELAEHSVRRAYAFVAAAGSRW